MIIDLKEIEKLRKFIFNEIGLLSEEAQICHECWNNIKKYKCKDYDFCQKYTPITVGRNITDQDGMTNLINDLFDTIKYLMKSE